MSRNKNLILQSNKRARFLCGTDIWLEMTKGDASHQVVVSGISFGITIGASDFCASSSARLKPQVIKNLFSLCHPLRGITVQYSENTTKLSLRPLAGRRLLCTADMIEISQGNCLVLPSFWRPALCTLLENIWYRIKVSPSLMSGSRLREFLKSYWRNYNMSNGRMGWLLLSSLGDHFAL
jgi:hypothetical protein